MKLTIYHGTIKPVKATKKAIDKLISKNVIILNSYNQFKINL